MKAINNNNMVNNNNYIQKKDGTFISFDSFITKRDGTSVKFDLNKIAVAINKALIATDYDGTLEYKNIGDENGQIIANQVALDLMEESNITVERCQDIVETNLMKLGFHKTAKAYILYRDEHNKNRKPKLSENWIAESESAAKYFDTPYQYIVFLRTYAKWLPEKNRRETWLETVDRFMQFMIKHSHGKISNADLNEVRAGITNMEVLPSMRLLQFAGPAVERNNLCAYNCCYIAPESTMDLRDMMYILMCGTGVGYSVERRHVYKFPTIIEQTGEHAGIHIVGDSREGWCDAYYVGLEAWFNGKDITFDYSKIRPAGARLKTSGGRASGPAPLIDLLEFSREMILSCQGGKLAPLDVHDICCKIGKIVVVGGVRRSAEISLSDLDSKHLKNCKHGKFYILDPQRFMANNSAVYNKTPTDTELDVEWAALKASNSGERGIFSRSHLDTQLPSRRVKFLKELIKFLGTNPCGEILLLSKQLCNLSTIICRVTDTVEDLCRKIRLAAIIGTFQATLTDFKYVSPEFKINCEAERLLGVSMTGQRDCPALNDTSVMSRLKDIAIKNNVAFSKMYGINPSTCVTCTKPEGTVSELCGTSSGLHARYAPYYIRRIRISAVDPLALMLRDQGVPYNPEVGDDPNDVKTYVFEFPIKSPDNSVCIKDLSAVDQLEYWKKVKINFTEHNPSATITIKPNEWNIAKEWIKDNWQYVGGLSFLPSADHVYELAPFEEITQREFEKLESTMPKIKFHEIILYEKEDATERKQTWACAGDKCMLT